MLRYLSVCSGIEAASCAWQPLGWKPEAFSEIEPFPCALLKHYHPTVPNYGDLTKFKEWPDTAIDLLVGGTPCQSFSVAGLRKGLADPRGNLTLTYLAVANRYKPRWVVWENVPGVLSSNRGRDFGAFLGALAQLGYGFAYRVLDAQYFGVAQRRRRVFVVGHLGDWRRAAAVLFDAESVRGNPAPRREAGQGFAAGAVAGTLDSRHAGGFQSAQAAAAAHLIPETVGALCDGAHMGGGLTAKTRTRVVSSPSIANPLTARMHKGINTTLDEGQTPIVVGGVFDDATPINLRNARRGKDQNGLGVAAGDAMFTLDQASQHAIAFQPRIGRNGRGYEEEVVPALNGADAGATSDMRPCVAFAQNSRDEVRLQGGDGQIVGALAAEPGMKQTSYVAATIGQRMRGQDDSCADNLQPVGTMAVRRLTPRECERLQGFPDDYTLITFRNKPAADGPRYRALGNSMAVPVMRWIGEAIAFVDSIEG